MNNETIRIDPLRRFLLCLHLAALSAVAQDFTFFARDLQKPARVIVTPQGNLLVSEGGLPEPNTGRVSFIDRGGNRRSLLEGLPNARGYTLNPFGPTGMALDSDTLYLLIGEGDVQAFRPPALRLNPDGPSSPIFSAILKIRFSAEVDRLRGGFRLQSPGDWALLDGHAVRLENTAGERANLELLTAFRPIVRNVLGGTFPYRQSNPYAVALDARNRTLWVTDAGMETVIKVDTESGRHQVVYRFEPIIRTTASGLIAFDNVPAGACLQGDQLLVSMFTVGGQLVGESAIWSIDTRTWAARPVVRDLTAIGDVLCGAEGPIVIENLLNLAPAQQLTRLSVIQRDGKRTLADVPANSPANVIAGGMAQDPASVAIYVARTGVALPGDIVRVATR